jgi:hypothetical protein
MISHSKKCIFVEVPRTGSTSVRNLIGMSATPHLNIWQIRSQMCGQWSHEQRFLPRLYSAFNLLRSEAKRIEAGERRFYAYYKFGFVRNPWDRVVSLYFRPQRESLRERMSFEDFVMSIKYSSATCYHPVPHRNQLDWFVNPDGEVLVDFIGRFERIEEDWSKIAAQLGLQGLRLPHKNQKLGSRKHYSEMYTRPEMIEAVREVFRVDIEAFNYEFGA